LYTFGSATYAGQHLAERSGGGVDIDGGSGDIREQGMKDHVVLSVEEKNLTVGWAQLAAKSFCELNGRKSSTDDDHSDCLHFFAPIPAPTTNQSFPRHLKISGAESHAYGIRKTLFETRD
jgi:hypothetical protein